MIKGIFAMDYNGGIGKNNTLPWPHNKEDMQRFKRLTEGHYVVMGSKTWDDPKFPGPLKNRHNIVVTRKTNGYEGASRTDKPIEIVQNIDRNCDKDIWIIGGSEIFNLFKDIIEEWHITVFHDWYECDKFFEISEGRTTHFEINDEQTYMVVGKK
jgi:dihydrofolate reductase